MSIETSLKPCPDPTVPCLAQVGPSAIDVTVSPMGDCCTNLVQEVDPIPLLMKEIRAAILKGTVVCGSSTIGVEGVIVIATASNGTNYLGVTNENGEYSICVPAVNSNTSYSIEAYCTSSCSGDFCENGSCNCGCKTQLSS